MSPYFGMVEHSYEKMLTRSVDLLSYPRHSNNDLVPLGIELTEKFVDRENICCLG